MSQSEFDHLSDGLLALLPEEFLSARPDPIWMSSQAIASPLGHNLGFNSTARMDIPTLEQARGLVLSGARGQISLSSSQDDPVADSETSSQPSFALPTLTLTHVSGTPDQSGMTSSPSTTGVGPLQWNAGALCLSESSRQIRARLFAVLRDSQEDRVLDELMGFDDEAIKQGVDLVIAGMLERTSLVRMHAQQLQTAIRVLVARRHIHFSHHARFETLLRQLPDSDTQELVSLTESDQQLVTRIWGPQYQKTLNISRGALLYRDLARLARFAETLNQSPLQIANYLEEFRAQRVKRRAKGRRSTVTGQDVRRLNTQLRRLIANNLDNYTETVTIEPGNRMEDGGDDDLQAFCGCSESS
jgi:hypothetical protein